MSENINLNNSVTAQIRQYVSRLKERKTEATTSSAVANDDFILSLNNDLRSNINTLNGDNKFNIQQFALAEQNRTPAGYAADAYNHLSTLEQKHKVVIDFMHKNNRNFDVKA